MKKYIYTSDYLKGEVEFVYDEETGWLQRFSFDNAEPTERQRIWMCQNLPIVIQNLIPVLQTPTSKITEIEEEVTFDMFWKRYREKFTSYKAGGIVPAEKAWNKLTKGEQNLAFKNIERYSLGIMPNCNNVYASTYLNQKRFVL